MGNKMTLSLFTPVEPFYGELKRKGKISKYIYPQW